MHCSTDRIPATPRRQHAASAGRIRLTAARGRLQREAGAPKTFPQIVADPPGRSALGV